MRVLVRTFGHFVAAIGLIGLAIEIHGNWTGDPRADVFGIVLSIAALCAGAFTAYAMHAGYRLRWSGALAVVTLLFAVSSWGIDVRSVLRGEPVEPLGFVLTSVLPAVVAG